MSKEFYNLIEREAQPTKTDSLRSLLLLMFASMQKIDSFHKYRGSNSNVI